ncbi:hypothetical protein V2J09_019405 [Rumex salicifolius]
MSDGQMPIPTSDRFSNLQFTTEIHSDCLMETEDMKLSTSIGTEPGSDRSDAAKMDSGLRQDEVVGEALNRGQVQQNGHDVEIEEGQLIPETPVIEGAANNSIVTVNEGKSCNSEPAFNERITVQNEISIDTQHINDNNTTIGVKRSRIEGLQSSVSVKYDDLPRDSKRKLQELLKRWSEWHERYCSSSYEMTEVLESGEETYFPALHIGLGNKSAVSFWMDNQMRKPEDDNLISAEDDSVPLYDRGFSFGLASVDGPSNLEGGLEVADASRCFNCGSYSHALKECPKPRDNAAVNNARKQQKTKRNQNAGFRNAARYYESPARGKYEGLRPGVLDPETRRLLGLGELDPPPWLQRMREIGYPPGYLETEEVDQPSGITIYADEESKREGDHEDGEILETDHNDPLKKKSVEFPGINAPIPENADKRRWESGIPKYDPFRDPLQDREDDKSDHFGRRRFQETRSRDFKNDSSSHPSRYSSQEASYTSNSRSSARHRDRDRDNRSAREDSPSFGLYSSFSYPSPSNISRRPSHHESGEYTRGRDREDRNRHHTLVAVDGLLCNPDLKGKTVPVNVIAVNHSLASQIAQGDFSMGFWLSQEGVQD